MWKVTQLIGRSIVSANSGEKLGKVTDVLLHDDAHQVIGLVVAGGVLSSERVLPYGEIQTLGSDAVVARSATGLITAKDWHARSVIARRTSALRLLPVLTVSGRAVGEIRDILVDEQGTVEGFEVAGGSLLRRRSTISNVPGLTIGSDAVLVPDAAVPARQQD
jgi:uncharacterized protein YrrD